MTARRVAVWVTDAVLETALALAITVAAAVWTVNIGMFVLVVT